MRGTSWVVAAVLLGCGGKPPVETITVAAPPKPSVVAVVATSAAPSASVAAPTPDWKGELAWARGAYPELAALRDEIDAKPFLAWVSSSGTLYLSAESHRCAEVAATREDDAIKLVIHLPEHVVAGHRVRDYIDGRASESLRFGYGGGSEERGADGLWVPTAGWGASDIDDRGWLVSVDGDVARFEAEPVRVEPSCGPWVDVSCPSGGTHRCNQCTDIQFRFAVLRGLVGMHHARATIDTCAAPCPEADNPDLGRLEALFGAVDVLYRETATNSRKPSRLYRTLTACKSDSMTP
jgi:hypothetical protein